MGKDFHQPHIKQRTDLQNKELKRLDIKILNNPIKKRCTELNREFSTEEFQWLKILKDMFNFLSCLGNAK